MSNGDILSSNYTRTNVFIVLMAAVKVSAYARHADFVRLEK